VRTPDARRAGADWPAETARREAAVTELGRRGLAGVSVQSLLEDAVSLLATTFGAEFAAVLAVEAGGGALHLTAGVGWRPGTVGTVRVDAGRESLAGYTLLAREPVIIDDLPADARVSSVPHLSEHGVKSAVGIALLVDNEPWGVIGAYSTRPRHFDVDDLSYLRAVAEVVSTAIGRWQREAALRESRERLELAVAAGGLGTWEWDMVTNEVAWSESLEVLFGLDPGSFGRTYADFLQLVEPEDRDGVEAAVERARQDAAEDFRILHRTRRPDGELRWIEGRGRVIVGGSAEPARMIGVAADVTERHQLDEMRARLLEREHQLRMAAEANRERIAFLAQAQSALSATLDRRQALEDLCALTVPRLADWCIVEMLGDDGELEAVVSHVEKDKSELAIEARHLREAAGGEGLWSVRRTIRTGRSELVPSITDDQIDEAASSPRHGEVLRALAPRSVITVPLLHRTRVLGGVTMVVGDVSGRRYGPDELAFAEELSDRAALALENARLYEERSRVARTLQQSLLPPMLPDVPGMALAACYRPAGAGAELGGDFYDLFELSDGAWAVTIGDVCGKGTTAAALTGLFRHTVRATAVHEHLPSRVLAITNDVILDQIEPTRFCTAAFLRVEPSAAGGARVTMSCGGHPEPVLLRPDGRIEVMPCRGTLLGMFPEPPLADYEVVLEPGDMIVLYTDGVVEARQDVAIFGEDRLLQELAAVAGHSPLQVVEHLERVLREFQGPSPSDDLAILVLQAV
jgi:PAS domain S-box-containing protein